MPMCSTRVNEAAGDKASPPRRCRRWRWSARATGFRPARHSTPSHPVISTVVPGTLDGQNHQRGSRETPARHWGIIRARTVAAKRQSGMADCSSRPKSLARQACAVEHTAGPQILRAGTVGVRDEAVQASLRGGTALPDPLTGNGQGKGNDEDKIRHGVCKASIDRTDQRVLGVWSGPPRDGGSAAAPTRLRGSVGPLDTQENERQTAGDGVDRSLALLGVSGTTGARLASYRADSAWREEWRGVRSAALPGLSCRGASVATT